MGIIGEATPGESLSPRLHEGVLEDILANGTDFRSLAGSESTASDVSPVVGDYPVRTVSYQEEADGESEKASGDQDTDKSSQPVGLDELIRLEQEKTKADSQLDDPAKSERLAILENAATWTQRAKEYQRKFDRFKTDNAEFKQNLERIQASLKEFETRPEVPELDPQLSSEEFQRKLQDVQSKLESRKAELIGLQGESRQFSERITELPKLKAEAEQRLKAVQEQLKDKTEVQPATTDEKELLQFAIREGTEAELEMLRVESSYLENSAQLSPYRIDLANRRLKLLEAEAQQLGRDAELARNRQVEQQIEEARQAAMEAIPQLAEFAQGNEQLAGQRKELAEKIAAIASEAKRVEKQAKNVESELASMTEKLEEGAANADSLSESRQQLITPWESRFRLGELQKSLQGVKLTVIKLQEERERLSDPDAFMTSQLKISPDNPDVHAVQMATEIVENKKVLLDALLVDNRTYRRELSQTIAQREKLLKGLSETQTFLNKHMLWTQNMNPVRVKTLQKSSQGMQEFFSASGWSGVGTRLLTRMMDRPHEYFLCGLGAVFLIVIVRRFKD